MIDLLFNYRCNLKIQTTILCLYYQKRPCIYKSCTTYLKFLLNYPLLLKSYFKLDFGLKTYFCYSTLGGTRNCSWNRISNKICMAAIHLAQVKYSLNTSFFLPIFQLTQDVASLWTQNCLFFKTCFSEHRCGQDI